MDLTHCIVLCGGNNSRWGKYKNTHRKHLVEIESEILLNRTLRLVAAFNPDRTVVVVNKCDLELYSSKLSFHAELYGIKPVVPCQTEAYKFLSSKELWNRAGRTIVLLGDVWFSEEAMAKIFNDAGEEWTAFGRAGASRYTGCPYGEIFAQRFTCFAEHGENLARLNAMYLKGTCMRPASGWAHYQLMIGSSPNIHTVGPRFVEIDDFTEDFDCPEDYDTWVLRRSLFRKMQYAALSSKKQAEKSSNSGSVTEFTPSAKPVVWTMPRIGRNDPCPCGSGMKYKKCCGQ
jgi:hypothetical protein